MADLSSLIAQFGQGAGSTIASGVNRGLERSRQNRLYEIARQDKAEQAAATAQADQQTAQREHMGQLVQVLESLPPEQRAEAWAGGMQHAQNQGWAVDPAEMQWNDAWLPKLRGQFGVAREQSKEGQRRMTKGADGYQYWVDSGERVLPGVEKPPKDEGAGGVFAGTGIEAQMLNIALDDSIPDSDPRKVLARQRLEKETTTVTPEGTYIRPGYDLASLSASQAVSPAAAPTVSDDPARTQFVEKPPTDAEKLSAGFYDRMVNAQGELDRLLSESPEFNPASTREAARGASNYTASAEYQQYRQAANDWIRAKLRKESGAVIGPEEMLQEYETYFPIPGDGAEVMEQKARARELAERAMRRSAGRAAPEETANVIDWSDL